MLRHLREPLLLASTSGQILAANIPAADALGASAAALVGTSVGDLAIDPRGLQDRLDGPNPGRPLALRGREGHRFACYVNRIPPDLLLLRLSGGPDAAPRVRDFLEAMAGSGIAEPAGSLLERLHAFTRLLARAITTTEVTEAVVDMGIAATGAGGGGLWLLSEDGVVVCLARAVGAGGPRPEDFVDVPIDRPVRMPILDAIRDERPTWVESCAEMKERYPESFRAFSRGGDYAIACVPLLAQGRCLGGLTYKFDDARVFQEQEKAFLQVIAWHSAQAIERSKLYAAEKRAREAAESSQRIAREADRQKDEFLAMLSHELRNPLAPIVSALHVMKLSGDGAFATERAIIERHVEAVVRLVDDLLDVARVTTGKIELRKERLDLAHAVAKAVEMVRPQVDARGQRLAVEVANPPIHVVADEARLAQAIANLLANATKYTQDGGAIAIRVESSGSEAIVTVKDTGIGIPPEALPRIFDLFVQEAPALDRGRGGLGVGLRVVKDLVGLHGGSVSARSEGLGRGSEFVIRLPLASLDAPEAEAPAGPVAAPAPRPRGELRVLLVDDNVDGADMIGAALEAMGCAVRVVYDGFSALSEAAGFKPDLALVDIGLPGMNGYDLAGNLRKVDGLASVRIVAVTGYGQEQDFVRSREAGIDEHVVKPMGLETLQEVLGRVREVGPTKP
jgi:signal transduction histidine kinase/CheY-like chemotaxis protein